MTKLSTIPIRSLIDTGSEITFISDSLVQTLNLLRTQPHLNVLEIGSAKAGRTKGCVNITLRSLHSANEINIRTHILGGMSTHLPASSIPSADLAAFSDLKLADPGFCSPGPIDIIIGSDYYGQIIINEIIRGKNPGIFAQNTIFGWVIMGPVRIRARYAPRTFHAISSHQNQNLQDLLTRFWVQEEITSIPKSLFSPEEEACETHFESTHTRDSIGRYIVRLPLLKSPNQLGDSFKPVIRCLHHHMGRLNRDSWLKALYTEFMADYINLNHMVPATSSSDRTQYFLPHHGVLKEVNNQYKLESLLSSLGRSLLRDEERIQDNAKKISEIAENG